MKALPYIIVALVTGVVGFIVGSLQAPESANAPALGQLEAPSEAGVPAASEPRKEIRQAKQAAPDEPSPAAQAPARSGNQIDDKVETLIQELSKELDTSKTMPTGEGRIFGKVVDSNGNAIPGVTLIARFSPVTDREYGQRIKEPRVSGEIPAYYTRTERETVRSTLQNLRSSQAWQRTVISDAQGMFSINGLGDVQANVGAYHKDYNFQDNRMYQVVPSEEALEITGKPISYLDLTVVLPDGSEPQWSTLRIRTRSGNGSSSTQDGWNPAKRQLQLLPGNHTISASYDVDGTFYSSKEETLEITEGTPASLRIQLEAETTLEVTLDKVWKAKPLRESHTEFTLTYWKAADGDSQSNGNERGSRGEHSSVHFTRGQTQQFIRNLEPGVYHLALSTGYSSRSAAPNATVTVAAGNNKTTLTYDRPAAGTYTSLRVLAPDGNLVTKGLNLSGSLRVESRGGVSGSSGGGVDAMVDEDGSIVVIIPTSERDTEGAKVTYTITANHSEYPGASVTLEQPYPASAVIQFFQPCSATVQLSGYTDAAQLKKFSISLYPKSENQRGGRYYSRDENGIDNQGRQTFDNLAPGEYTLTLSSTDERRRTSHLASQDVTIGPGSNSLSLVVPRLQSLTIVGVTPNTSVSLRATSGIDYSEYKQANDKGEVTFDNVPDGEYTLRSGRSEMSIRVPSGGTIPFVETVYNAMRITIEDANGAFAKAGFQTGDLLINVAGIEIESMETAQLAILTAIAKGECDWIFLRNGQRMTIKHEVKSERDLGRGVDFDPAVR